MKTQKLISLDIDVANKLKKVKNASGFINKLLREHLKVGEGECNHVWSNYFSTPGGLARECSLCGKTELKNKDAQ
jgi:hypothetical protein